MATFDKDTGRFELKLEEISKQIDGMEEKFAEVLKEFIIHMPSANAIYKAKQEEVKNSRGTGAARPFSAAEIAQAKNNTIREIFSSKSVTGEEEPTVDDLLDYIDENYTMHTTEIYDDMYRGKIEEKYEGIVKGTAKACIELGRDLLIKQQEAIKENLKYIEEKREAQKKVQKELADINKAIDKLTEDKEAAQGTPRYAKCEKRLNAKIQTRYNKEAEQANLKAEINALSDEQVEFESKLSNNIGRLIELTTPIGLSIQDFNRQEQSQQQSQQQNQPQNQEPGGQRSNPGAIVNRESDTLDNDNSSQRETENHGSTFVPEAEAKKMLANMKANK